MTAKRDALIRIPAIGDPEVVTVLSLNGNKALGELRKLIGNGWLEVVTVPQLWATNVTMLVDEEGHMKRLPVNLIATKIAGQMIVGPALIVKGVGEGFFTPDQSIFQMLVPEYKP